MYNHPLPPPPQSLSPPPPPVPIPSFQVPQRQDDFALLLPTQLPNFLPRHLRFQVSLQLVLGELSLLTRYLYDEFDCFIVRNLELTRDNWVILGIVNTLKRCSCSLWLRRPTSRTWRMIPLWYPTTLWGRLHLSLIFIYLSPLSLVIISE